MFRSGTTLILLALVAAPAAAQTLDAPSFHTPFSETGFGAYAFSPRADEYGGMAMLRRSGERVDLGLRAGWLDLAAEDRYFAAVDVKRGAADPDATGGEAALVTGFGVGWIPDRDRVRLRFPLGLTWGARHVAGSLAYVPYVHPRAFLDLDLEQARSDAADEDWDSELDLGFAVDLGFDLEIRRSVALRFAATVGKDDAVGLGVAFRGL